MIKENISNFRLISLINPGYVYNRIKTIRSLDELKKKAKDLIVLFLKIATFRYGARYWEKKRQENLANYMDDIDKIDEISMHCEKGEYYFGRKDYEKALKIYNRILKLDKGNKTAYFRRGEIRYIKKENEEAIENLKKAVEYDKNNGYAYRTFGNIYKQKKEYDKALKEFKKALELSQSDKKTASAIYSEIAQVYLEEEKYDLAIEEIKKAIGYDKGNGFAYMTLGSIYRHRKEFDKALEELDRSIELSEGNKEKSSEIYIEKALVYIDRQDPDYAESILKKAVELNPSKWTGHLLLAKVYMMQIRPEEALEEYGKAIGLNVGDKSIEKKVYEDRVEIYSQLGRYDKMAEEINRLINMGFSGISNHVSLSVAYKMQGLDEEAEKAFDKAMGMIKQEKGIEIGAKDESLRASKKEENRIVNEGEIANGETRLKSKVRSLSVALTNRCNLRCKMCFIDKAINPEMSWKVKEEIIRTFPYLEDIIWLGGEVFLDADFNRMIEEAMKYGIKQNITTNGLLLNEELVRKFINNGIELVISIDGTTKEVYESIRRGASYERMIDKLNMINKIRKQVNPGYVMNLNVVVMRSNYRQIESFPDFAKEHGFNNLNYMMVAENRNNENIFNFDRDEDILSCVDRALDKAREKCRKYSISFSSNITKGILQTDNEVRNNIPVKYFENKTEVEKIKERSDIDRKKVICLAPWKALNIDIFGNVNPYIGCSCKYIVGNLNESSLEEIWNGERMVKYRESIVSGNLWDVCDLKKVYNRIPAELFK